MTPQQKWTSFYTMLRKDMVRIFRIWVQTFLPSVVTSCLYFLIFGKVLGPRIGEVHGVDYMTFVVPGLVMLAIVTNAAARSAAAVGLPRWSSTTRRSPRSAPIRNIVFTKLLPCAETTQAVRTIACRAPLVRTASSPPNFDAP